jgi:hypothetical protein
LIDGKWKQRSQYTATNEARCVSEVIPDTHPTGHVPNALSNPLDAEGAADGETGKHRRVGDDTACRLIEERRVDDSERLAALEGNDAGGHVLLACRVGREWLRIRHAHIEVHLRNRIGRVENDLHRAEQLQIRVERRVGEGGVIQEIETNSAIRNGRELEDDRFFKRPFGG